MKAVKNNLQIIIGLFVGGLVAGILPVNANAEVAKNSPDAIPAHVYQRLRRSPDNIKSEEQFPKKTLYRKGKLTLAENKKFWFLNSDEYVLTVEKETGLIHSLKSLCPDEIYLLPPTQQGLVIYMWNDQYKDYVQSGWLDWVGVFNRLIKNSVKTGRKEGQDYIQLKCILEMDNEVYRDYAQVNLIYTLFEDRLDISAAINYKKTDVSGFQIGIGHIYDKNKWVRHLYPLDQYGLIGVFPIDTDEKSIERYRQASWDSRNTVEDPIGLKYGGGKAHIVATAKLSYYEALWDRTPRMYDPEAGSEDFPQGRVNQPYGIVEGKDRFFLWGYLDISSFTVLTPNRNDWIPSFMISPQGITKGKSYSFDYTYKVFPKPQNTITDVCRWYAQNRYSSNSQTKGMVHLPKKFPHRTLPIGNLTTGPPYPPSSWGAVKEFTPLDELFHKMDCTLLWWGGNDWNRWDESVLVKGSWYNVSGNKVSAVGIKQEVKTLQNKGYKILAYTRQLHRGWCYFYDKPRYKRWILRGKGGWPFNEWIGARPEVTAKPIQPGSGLAKWKETEPELEGLDVEIGGGLHADFCNPELRKWYMDGLKKAIAYYDFDGLGWDMGWDIHVGMSADYPEVGIHHGILRLMHDMREWMKKNYPEKLFVINGANTPCNLYMDAGIIDEGGWRCDKLSMDAVKVYNMPVTALHYSGLYRDIKYKGFTNWHDLYLQHIMRVLSYGATFSGQAGIEVTELANAGLLEKVLNFSARANSVPWVTESHAIEFEPVVKVTGSVWANKDNLLIAIFNDNETPVNLIAKLNVGILAKYGQDGKKQVTFTITNSEGFTRPDKNFTKDVIESEGIIIKGILGGKELVLIE